jgi:hypothetical protein
MARTLPRHRRQEHAETVHVLQLGIGLERATDEGVALEERIAPRERRGQVLQVQGLKVSPHVHHHIAVLIAQRFDLLAGTKMVVLSVSLPGPGGPRIEQDDGLEVRTQVGMEPVKRLGERALPHTRRPREDDEPTSSPRQPGVGGAASESGAPLTFPAYPDYRPPASRDCSRSVLGFGSRRRPALRSLRRRHESLEITMG